MMLFIIIAGRPTSDRPTNWLTTIVAGSRIVTLINWHFTSGQQASRRQWTTRYDGHEYQIIPVDCRRIHFTTRLPGSSFSHFSLFASRFLLTATPASVHLMLARLKAHFHMNHTQKQRLRHAFRPIKRPDHSRQSTCCF